MGFDRSNWKFIKSALDNLRIMENNLEKSILSTIIFYDIFGLPLTVFEIHKYLIRQPSTINRQPQIKLSDVLEALERSEFLKRKIGQKMGFYFLAGKDSLIEGRIEKQKLADLKWRKLRRLIFFLRGFPFVRMVMVTGSLAFGNVKNESDFDILIFVKAGRVWSVRFLTTLFFWILGLRRSEKNTCDKICLNHYLAEDALEIKSRNLYEAQAYARFLPVLENEKGFYRKFCAANGWIGDWIVSWPEKFIDAEAGDIAGQRKVKTSRFLNFKRRSLETMLGGKAGDLLERALKKIQLRHIERHPLKDKAGGRIIASDEELEFHPELHSQKVLAEYERVAESCSPQPNGTLTKIDVVL